jgi:GNAT superfamily N-acetyltransferase
VSRIVALAPEHEPAFAALFEACASSCFCQFWHFEGNKNAWLSRAADDPHQNRTDHAALLVAGDPRADGLLAFDGDLAVGWMKLTPRAAVPKLRRLPVYKALDLGDDDGVWSIGCFLVRPSHRGTGIARALLAAAEAHVLACGGHAIEGYPRRSTEPMHAEEAWMGPETLFTRAGFMPVGGEAWAAPYPVLRKQVGLGSPPSRPPPDNPGGRV